MQRIKHRHNSRLILPSAGILLAVFTACTHDGLNAEETAPGAPPGSMTGAIGVDDVVPIMQAKLGYTHALLDAIALRDFLQVEASAMALSELSNASDWLVHDTVAYRLFSERFREAAEDLAFHAREEDIDAVSRAYLRLSTSCVDCHSYLRREREKGDMPGRLSMIAP